MSWPFRVTDPLLEVLEVFLDVDSSLHGWAIMKETRRSGPTVYQVLERLRKARWVDCWWEDEDAPADARPPVREGPESGMHERDNTPRRRYYRLSDEGAARAPALLAERGRRRGAAQSALHRPIPGLATFARFRLSPGEGLS